MLPRLCYIGPAVRAGMGGPALLYKLLCQYPPKQLLLIQTHVDEIQGDQLAAAQVINLPSLPSFLGQRMRTLYQLSFFAAKRIWMRALLPAIRRFEPEAIVCVVHGWSAEVALVISEQLGIPFHAIIHDAPKVAMPAPHRLTWFRDRRWRDICRRASTRLCVSPYMADETSRITNMPIRILYPGLAGQPVTDRSCTSKSTNLRFAFAGQIHQGYTDVLSAFGAVLKERGHQLTLHSPQAGAFIEQYTDEGAVDGGWIRGDQLAATLAREADALLLPMSFRPEDQHNTRVSFPSKLAEYCAAGRPVIICAPCYASVVRWAANQPDFAQIVQTLDRSTLARAVVELESPVKRDHLSRGANTLARNVFSHEATYGEFVNAITSVQTTPNSTHGH